MTADELCLGRAIHYNGFPKNRLFFVVGRPRQAQFTKKVKLPAPVLVIKAASLRADGGFITHEFWMKFCKPVTDLKLIIKAMNEYPRYLEFVVLQKNRATMRRKARKLNRP